MSFVLNVTMVLWEGFVSLEVKKYRYQAVKQENYHVQRNCEFERLEADFATVICMCLA